MAKCRTPDQVSRLAGRSWTGKHGGSPWEFRDRYIENSPLFYIDRAQTPLLIIHGDLDTAVPYEQAEEVFVALRRLGKESSMQNMLARDTRSILGVSQTRWTIGTV